MSKIDEYSKKIKARMSDIRGVAKEKVKSVQKNIEKFSGELPKKLGYGKLKQEAGVVRWIKEKPRKFYGILVIILILMVSLATWIVVHDNIKKAEIQAKIKQEESREYYIKAEDITVNCGASFNSMTDSLECEKVKISGEFSKYETVKLKDGSGSKDSINVDGNKFEAEKKSSFGLIQFYYQDNYNPQEAKFLEEKVTFEIFNNVLNRSVKKKTITIRYNLTDEERKKFADKFSEYKNKKQTEVEEYQRKQAEEKAKKEREAEEQKRRDAEKKAAEDQAKRDASRHKVSESASEYFCKDQVISRHPQIGSIKVSDYFGNYKEFYNNDNTFDKNGDYIIRYQWTGKNKQTDQSILFSCYVSGRSDSDVTLHYLSAGSLDLYGSLNFEEYNKDGQIVQ